MANRTRKTKATAIEEDSDDHESPPQPEGKVTGTVLSRAEKMFGDDNKRRDAQRKAVVKEHEQRVKTTKAKVSTLYSDRKTRVCKSQRVLWERLDNLNKRRQDIEGQILASIKNIEQQTTNVGKQVNAVFDGRVTDIQDPGAE